MTLLARMGCIALALLGAGLAGCGSNSDEPGTSTPAAEKRSTAATATARGPEIEGKFDVGGHKLFISCKGSGSPTVIYLHGAITEESIDPHSNGAEIQGQLSEEQRVCLYDRRNLAHSDEVEGPQTPGDAIGDLEGLLKAAEVEPPYVLLGASFGGLLAYLFMGEHPDEVEGMVLLDSPVPGELSLDHLLPPEERYIAFDKEDRRATPERISHYRVFKAAEKYIGREPAIPVTYLASTQEPPDTGVPAVDRGFIRLRKAYVDRFDPGRLIEVDAPHFMEPAIPAQIADELRAVIDAAS